MNTIDRLKALEKAAADSHRMPVPDREYIAAAMFAIPALLKVAKAAKAYTVLSHAGADTHDAYLELWAALEELEAQ